MRRLRLGMMAGGIPLDPDAQAFLTAAGITDATITTAIDTLVTDLKLYGLWTKLKAIYPFVGGTASTHKFNLKDPQDTNAAFRLVFAGGWTHSATGAQPNGTNAYADTFYVPNIHSNSQNNSISFYSRTNSNAGQPYDIFASDGSNTTLRPFGLIVRYSTNVAYFSNGNLLHLSASNLNGEGFYQGFTDITNQRLYRNAIELNNIAIPTNSFPTLPIYIGAANNGGTAAFFSNKQCAFASMGGSKLTTTEAIDYYTAVQAFQTTLGRQV